MTHREQMIDCKNCGKAIAGNFCSHCGQKTSVSRITASKLVSELSESIFQFDAGLFYTVKALFKKPGASILDFINGKRKKHFKPIAYVLFFSTVYFLISNLTGQATWMNDIISGFTEGALDLDEASKLPEIVNWFANNYAYTTLLLIPVFSLASYFCFAKFEANYMEHIVLNSYITGHQAIFYALFSLANSIIDSEVLGMLPLYISMLYCFWVFFQFFMNGNRIGNVIRSILTYLVYMIFSSVLFLIIIALQGYT